MNLRRKTNKTQAREVRGEYKKKNVIVRRKPWKRKRKKKLRKKKKSRPKRNELMKGHNKNMKKIKATIHLRSC